MTYFLYIKTHNITNLKYLGYTTKEKYHEYKGSGVYWKRHLKKYGCDYKTDLLLKTEVYAELIETSMFFSKLFNITNNTEFANLIDETGSGGDTSKHIVKRTSVSNYWK